MTRARRRRGAWLLAAFVVLLSIFALSTWSFIRPSVDHDYRLAAASDFAPGTVTSFVREGDGLAPYTRQSPSPNWGWSVTVTAPAADLVHVVRLPDGDFRVLAGVSPHLRQPVLWFPDATTEVGQIRGLFGDDFSWWLVDGSQVFGPAPRDLPTYHFEIDDAGVLVIDLSEPIEGEWLPGRQVQRTFPPLPYDVNDPDWPTSGWPSAAN